MIKQSSILNSASPFRVLVTATVILLCLTTLMGCSSSRSSRQLARYDLRGAALAIDAPIAPPPVIITNADDDVWGLTRGTVESVFRAATAVVKESNADKARERFKRAAEQVDVSLIVARTLHDKTERYLQMRPTDDFQQADFVMALLIDEHGLFMGPSYDGRMAFFLNAFVELVDPHTHRTIWKKRIDIEEPVAQHVLFSNIRSAKELSEMEEEDLIEALERLSEYSADAIMRALRYDLAREYR